MQNMRKAQAAMEFLMTYGWAILVVLVAISALAYFGVLNPDKFLPSKCTLPSGIACIDHKATTATVTLVLRNAMGTDLTGVSVSTCGGTTASTTLDNGEKKDFIVTCSPALTGSKFSDDVVVSYTSSESGLSHNVSGSITTKIE